jgi:lipopolysaccharide cholinephosphotransferase
MLKSSEYLAQIAQTSKILYQLNETESKELKECLLSIYKDVWNICKKHNLVCMLGGGSALGAVRHQGFIPWDDDLDLLMPRKDYNILIDLFEKELGQDYYMYVPNSPTGSTNTFMKIMKKNTTLIDIFNVKDPFNKGIYIDIFPIEYTSNHRIFRYLKGYISDAMAFIGVSDYMYRFRNKYQKEYFCSNESAKRIYQLRLLIGFLCSFMKTGQIYNLYDKWVSTSKGEKNRNIPTGRKHYFGELLSSEVYLPPSQAVFEGITVEVPNNIHVYLENLYGDYMKIPPVEKRERHYFIAFDTKKRGNFS